MDVSNFLSELRSKLVLLIDSDGGSFSNATIVRIRSFWANIAHFDQVLIANGNWLTIANLIPSSLPVELTYFNAEKIVQTDVSNGSTQSETNNDYFEVQPSNDAQAWELLTEIPDKITSTSVQYYQYIAIYPETVDNYYRLKQVDIQGVFEYSEIETVNLAAARKRLRVYLNSSSDYFYI